MKILFYIFTIVLICLYANSCSESKFNESSPSVKTGVIEVSSNEFAGQAKPETVSATPVKASESTISYQTGESDPVNLPKVLHSYDETVPKMMDAKEIKSMFNLEDSIWRSQNRSSNSVPIQTMDYKNKNEYEKAEILRQLSNHEVSIRSYVVEADGKLILLGSQIIGKGKHILVQQDYINYRFLENQQKSGILLRVEADLKTLKGEVNLNSLFAVTIAVQTGSACGKLRIQVYGLSGEPITALLPLPSSISEESLMNALSAIATIKAKIYDEKVSVNPCLIPESI